MAKGSRAVIHDLLRSRKRPLSTLLCAGRGTQPFEGLAQALVREPDVPVARAQLVEREGPGCEIPGLRPPACLPVREACLKVLLGEGDHRVNLAGRVRRYPVVQFQCTSIQGDCLGVFVQTAIITGKVPQYLDTQERIGAVVSLLCGSTQSVAR